MSRSTARCWDCKDATDTEPGYRRFEPAVVPPPSAVIVCGPTCKATPLGRQVFHRDSLPADMMPAVSEDTQLNLGLVASG